MSSNSAGGLGLEFETPILELEKKIEELEAFSQTTEMDLSGQIEELRNRCQELKQGIFSKLTAWQRVQLARHPDRPLTLDYIGLLFQDFLELSGDRAFSDDQAIVTGLARLQEHRVLIVGHRKGKGTKEKVACNFGSAHPEGYRKALHKMKLAEKFGLPVVSLINTPGAYPGIGAEERGQAHVIAANLLEMSRLRVPVIVVVIGEGGSGGALGIGVGDRVYMLENAYYSVISPEGCAAILWKTAEKADRAAEALRLTAGDLLELGAIDEIIPEPLGGAHRDPVQQAETLRKFLLAALDELTLVPEEALLEARYQKLRKIGVLLEVPQPREPVAEGA